MGRLLFLAVFGVTGLAVLLALGTWQLRRLDWKEALLADIEARIAADPVALPAAPDADNDRYLPVTVSGEMLPGEAHVLVSVKRVGAGYRIIAPFETEDGRRVLIDRGFVPVADKTRSRATGPMTVTGNLHWPDEIDSYTPDNDLTGNTWFSRDVPTLAAHLKTRPVLIVARSQTDPHVTPLPVDTSGIPNDHLQYAVTWFGLAAVWAAMTGYFLWRPGARSTKRET